MIARNNGWTVPGSDRQVADIAGGKHVAGGIDIPIYTAGGSISPSTLGVTIHGSEYDDTLTGGSGNDVLYGEEGNDVLYGYDGDDVMHGGSGIDFMYGGTGNDTYYITQSQGNSQAIENYLEGYDIVYTSVDYSIGGQFIEELRAINNANGVKLYGNTQDNKIFGGIGTDFLVGSLGNDTLDGGAGNDKLHGNEGNDDLTDGGGIDHMYGGADNDVYHVSNSGTKIFEYASEGHDVVYTSVDYQLGNNYVEDLYIVGTGNVNVTANGLDNKIVGNSGNNYIHGAAGSDTITGGGGDDIFLFTSHDGIDQITDFGSGDKIHLNTWGFTALTNVGDYSFAPGQFHLGASAASASNRIIYDASKGNLYYDVDGLGGQSQVLFATFITKPTLTASDFAVFYQAMPVI